MTTPNPQLDISALAQTVADAQARHTAARRASSAARNEETSALNDLNSAQSNLDAALLKLRQEAHPESDWGRAALRKGVPCIV